MHTETLFQTKKKWKTKSFLSADRFYWMWHLVCIFLHIACLWNRSAFFLSRRSDAAISWGSFVRSLLCIPIGRLLSMRTTVFKALAINVERKIKNILWVHEANRKWRRHLAVCRTAGTGLLLNKYECVIFCYVVRASAFVIPDLFEKHHLSQPNIWMSLHRIFEFEILFPCVPRRAARQKKTRLSKSRTKLKNNHCRELRRE